MVKITEDALLNQKVTLHQPSDGYRVSTDSVMLAAAVPVEEGEYVLDVGAGVGASSICLAFREARCHVTGIEVQPSLIKLAKKNVEFNNQNGRVVMIEGDVCNPPNSFESESFDHVMTNPPFFSSKYTLAQEAEKAIARAEVKANLKPWIDFCFRVLKSKGTFTITYRAERLDELLSLLYGRIGELVVCPLWPKKGRNVKTVIVQGRKNISSPLKLVPGILMHTEDGKYTSQAEEILREAKHLNLQKF